MSDKVLSGEPLDLNGDKRNLLEVLQNTFEKHKENTFAYEDFSGRTSTYGEAFEAIKGFATALHRRKRLPKGAIISVISSTTLEVVYVMYGVWFAGMKINGFNEKWSRDVILDKLKLVQPSIIYCSFENLARVESMVAVMKIKPEIITPKEACQMFTTDSKRFTLPTLSESHSFAVSFTSGSSGAPKAVLLSEKSNRYYCLVQRIFEHRGPEPVLVITEIFWVSFTFVVPTVAMLGVPIVLLRDITDYDNILQLVHKYKPKVWFSSHTVLMNMAASPNRHKYDLSSLEVVTVGGSTVLGQTKRKIKKELLQDNCEIRNLYGSTEVGVATTGFSGADESSPQFDSVGQLRSGIQLKVVNTLTGEPLGPNQMGEILIKSVYRMAGILNADSTYGFDSEGFYRIGDIGFYDENKFLYITSRLKEVLIYRNHEIIPSELEAILNNHPDVQMSCVVGYFDEKDGDLPTALVVLKPESSVTEEELIQYVGEKASPPGGLHGGVYLVNELPTSSVGKIQRSQVADVLKQIKSTK